MARPPTISTLSANFREYILGGEGFRTRLLNIVTSLDDVQTNYFSFAHVHDRQYPNQIWLECWMEIKNSTLLFETFVV